MALDISRHIAKIRAQQGDNFLALALQDIQAYVNLLPKTSTTTPAATAPAIVSGSEVIKESGFKLAVNGQSVPSANLSNTHPSPPATRNNITWQLDATLDPATISGWVPDYAVVLQDTHANRVANYSPSSYPLGTIFHETDRNAYYEHVFVASGSHHFVLTGCLSAAGANTLYDGTITGGAANAFVGLFFTTSGFANSGNNVTNAICVASTAFTITLANPDGIIETVAAACDSAELDAWVWYWGQMSGLLEPTELPSDLGVNDTNFKFYSTDFDRLYQWTGTVWLDFAGPPRAVYFFDDAPTTVGWVMCDGTTGIRRSKSDGTTELIDLPILNTGTYLKASTPYSGPNPTPAVNPTITGNTALESTHIHNVDPPNTPSSGPSGTTEVDNNLLGSVVFVGSDSHLHDVNILGFNSGAGSAHLHGLGTIAATSAGEPQSMDMLAYMRL